MPHIILFVFALAICLVIPVSMSAPTQPVERQVSSVPSFVLQYAPLIWLQSQDPYFPSDIGAQLSHTKPEINYTPVNGAPDPLTLDNLDSLNSLGGASIYLSSVDDITKPPAWFKGVAPDASGKTNGAVTSAVVVNDRGAGNVDVFYFYFYAYNQGNTVFGQEFGDHVGDWEHNMIRFKDGFPQTVWYSQHGNGQAFTYACLEKNGQRPVGYSAKGSHATYATNGDHDHAIPNFNLPAGFLEDHCDQGKIYDPTLSAYFYKYDAAANTFTPYDSSYPTSWLYFLGKWGDEQLPDSNPSQRNFFGQRKYTGGPTGPQDKQLNRKDVCPDNGNPCIVRPFLTP